MACCRACNRCRVDQQLAALPLAQALHSPPQQSRQPDCIGQKQKWFMLRLTAHESMVRFDCCEKTRIRRLVLGGLLASVARKSRVLQARTSTNARCVSSHLSSRAPRGVVPVDVQVRAKPQSHHRLKKQPRAVSLLTIILIQVLLCGTLSTNPHLDVHCLCHAVTECQIKQAVSDGVCSLRQVQLCLRVGTNCGKCIPAAREVVCDAPSMRQDSTAARHYVSSCS